LVLGGRDEGRVGLVKKEQRKKIGTAKKSWNLGGGTADTPASWGDDKGRFDKSKIAR